MLQQNLMIELPHPKLFGFSYTVLSAFLKLKICFEKFEVSAWTVTRHFCSDHIDSAESIGFESYDIPTFTKI